MQASTLQGKVALITGSTRGIGRAIAEGMAAAGATVIIHGRSPESAQAGAAALAAQGYRTLALAADLSQADAAGTLMHRAFEAVDTIDILVNNAGISPVVGRPEKIEMVVWHQIMQVNLTVPFQLAQAVGRRLIERGKPGAIINIASIGGQVALAGQTAYCASKAGLIGLTKSLAVDWARHRIRVNAIAPGYITTDLTAGVRQSERYSQMILSQTPLARLGDPVEVAGAAVFLASDAAAFITGAVLAIDGGWTAL
ncbi:MAG: glucose 1-dehydrogenase [Chloroflexi bacterium]|nr:glucose 1-dehydrogenase [Chloroflexota bacterium]